MSALNPLTKAEEQIMKCVWDGDKDPTVVQVIDMCKEKYQKSYAPSTVNTFFLHLSQKGYVEIYKIGHAYHFKKLVEEQEYLKYTFEKLMETYYNGSPVKLVHSIVTLCELTEQDKREVAAIANRL